MADSSINRFGLIGNPVSGSKSPDLFKAAYGGKFPYDLIEEPDFETAGSWAQTLPRRRQTADRLAIRPST